jgi:hypothetical protein
MKMITACFTGIGRALLAIAIIATIAAASPASASAQCCTSYHVTIDCMMPTPCFPMSVKTTWTNGLSRTGSYNGCGTFTEVAPSNPGCWGGITNLSTITINGVNIPAFFPCSAVVNIGCTCVRVCVSIPSSGCPIQISITRAPCP